MSNKVNDLRRPREDTKRKTAIVYLIECSRSDPTVTPCPPAS